jgi:hypothetical protein
MTAFAVGVWYRRFWHGNNRYLDIRTPAFRRIGRSVKLLQAAD